LVFHAGQLDIVRGAVSHGPRSDVMRQLVRSVIVLVGCTCGVAAAADQNGPAIPLCPGLTIVTAVRQKGGDYESIKTIQSVTNLGVRLKYSLERLVDDLFSTGPPTLLKAVVYRTVQRRDLDAAFLYEQQFSSELPETVPETTAIGTSAAVLNALKTKGEAKLGIFIAYSQKKPSIDRNTHPNVYDNQMIATITRVGKTPVMMPVLVNDRLVPLPTIQASGDFFGDKSEFFFLDDPANPLTLKFRVGIGGGQRAITPEEAKGTNMEPHALPYDKDVLQVVKISYQCDGVPASTASSGPAPTMADRGAVATAGAGGGGLERALSESKQADIYSIYFSFNSDQLREESEPTVKEIADVMRRHPDWKIVVNGHTDNIGGDQPNLDLSKRRAAAVRDALVKRYGIAPDRLTTSGFGRAQPKDTNDTIEGRARNRRVELIRS
jgi:outer membrane protein OmpA-like peptidoglycan-associated protein